MRRAAAAPASVPTSCRSVWSPGARRVAHINPAHATNTGHLLRRHGRAGRIHRSRLSSARIPGAGGTSETAHRCTCCEPDPRRRYAADRRWYRTARVGCGAAWASTTEGALRHGDACCSRSGASRCARPGRAHHDRNLGDATLHDFAARDRRTWFTDAGQTHDVATIARIPRFIAVNSAVEVDLVGEVNSERAGGALQAGAGGLPVFAQGAMLSPGGRLLICLRATAAGGTCRASCRPWARHVAPSHATWRRRRSWPTWIAELPWRCEACDGMIGIAAPEHRNGLAAAWERLRAEL